MTTYYCDVDEFATATDTIFSEITQLVIDTGSATDTTLIEITTIALASAVAISSSFYELGFDSSSSGLGGSAIVDQVDAVNILTSSGTAFDGLDDHSTDIVEEDAEAVSTVFDFAETLDTSSGVATDELLATTTRDQMTVESAVATSTLFGFNDNQANEAGVGTSTLFDQRVATNSIVEVGSAVSTVLMSSFAEDTALSVGFATDTAFFGSDTYEDFVTEIGFAIDGLFASPRNSAWVTNTETMAMSRYTALPIDSIASIGGLVLGLRQDGLLKMGADNDEGVKIRPSLRTGASQLNQPFLKQLGDVIVSYACSGTMAVRVATYNDKGNQGPYTYTLPPRIAAAPRANRLTVGKGLRGRYFSFEFLTEDGSSFDVDSMTVDVAINKRRF